MRRTPQANRAQRNCFPRDTLVATEAGLRPIGDIQAGEKVWAFDFRAGAWRLCPVECRDDSPYEGPIVTIGLGTSQVEATVYHPFWVSDGVDLEERATPRELGEDEDEGLSVPGRWVNSHELRAGDRVLLASGEQATIVRLNQRYERLAVCNLTVQFLSNFAVGEGRLLVHNMSGTGSPNDSDAGGPKQPQQPSGASSEMGQVIAQRIQESLLREIRRINERIAELRGEIRGMPRTDPRWGDLKRRIGANQKKLSEMSPPLTPPKQSGPPRPRPGGTSRGPYETAD